MPHQNILLSSDYPRATNKNSSNSAFGITINNPFTIPINARNIVVYCVNANIENFFYNISAALNNNVLYYTDDAGTPQKYSITFPDGSYEFANINQVLRTHFIVNGRDIDTIKFYAQDYTQKISVAVKNGWGIRIPTGLGLILGYAADYTAFNSGSNILYYDSTAISKFNKIISLNLSCSLCASCFYNGEYSNLMATIPITASIGRIVNYTPFIPTKIDSPQLAGSYINTIDISITDQINRPVNIAEEWNVSITIEWDE